MGPFLFQQKLLRRSFFLIAEKKMFCHSVVQQSRAPELACECMDLHVCVQHLSYQTGNHGIDGERELSSTWSFMYYLPIGVMLFNADWRINIPPSLCVCTWYRRG